MIEVRLQLRCTKKPGTLSRVIREINMVGLHYLDHRIENGDQYSRLTINANGEMNCSPESFREFFDDFPGVLEVQELTVTRGCIPVAEVKCDSCHRVPICQSRDGRHQSHSFPPGPEGQPRLGNEQPGQRALAGCA